LAIQSAIGFSWSSQQAGLKGAVMAESELTAQDSKNKRRGVLVGGGPAPGINGAISALTLKRNRAHRSSAFSTAFSG
jgi:hypothetical protein